MCPPLAAAGGAALTAEDRVIVDRVDTFLARGLALKRWWDRGGVRAPGSERFELAFTHNRPDTSYGFFSRTPVDGREMPILGNYQTQFYDQPKSPTADRGAAARFLDAQLRAFVLRYFMRVADFRSPQPYTEDDPSPPPLLRPLSMCTGRDVQRLGFGYSQLYYQRAGDGRVGKFPEAETSTIVDLRTLGPVYEWIVVKVRIFVFCFLLQPLGPNAPFATLPLAEQSLLSLTRDFVNDRTDPRPGEIGHYGLGYAFLKDPTPGLLAWGPGRFEAAFQTIDFRVLADGRIRVAMVFVANRPPGVLQIPLNPALLGLELLNLATFGALTPLTAPARALARQVPLAGVMVDPVFTGITLANLATAGLAARELCVSQRQVEKQLLLLHFQRHYSTIAGSLATWRQIRDWEDERSLPRWVVLGSAA
jgi:hypothetical protein